MKNQRTKVFQLRLTSDELLNLKEKAVPYQSVSNYIRKAVEEFTHVDVRQQIEMMQDLRAFYRKFQNELSWAGSNLNQSVKRANELAVAGLLAPSYVYEVLLPSIQDMQDTLNKLKEDLELLHRNSRHTWNLGASRLGIRGFVFFSPQFLVSRITQQMNIP